MPICMNVLYHSPTRPADATSFRAVARGFFIVPILKDNENPQCIGISMGFGISKSHSVRKIRMKPCKNVRNPLEKPSFYLSPGKEKTLKPLKFQGFSMVGVSGLEPEAS